MANFFLHDGYAVTGMGAAPIVSLDPTTGLSQQTMATLNQTQDFGTPVPASAPCPSFEQMMGIDDPNDPCQAATGVTASGATIVPPAIFNNPTPAVLAAAAAGGYIPPQPVATSNAGTYLIVGAVLLALVMMGGRR
jgi:hypothetical protein